MLIPAVDLGPTIFWLGLIDLPFFPRPPIYTLHIAQLVLGVICIRLALVREPVTDKSGTSRSQPRMDESYSDDPRLSWFSLKWRSDVLH
jgi:hypothetical protein